MQPYYDEARISRYNFFDPMPKAEVNLCLGMILAAGAAVFSVPLAIGVVTFSSCHYFREEKPHQNKLVDLYFEKVAPHGYRNGGGSVRYSDPDLQSIFRGVTHPFFRVGPDEQQSSRIMNNASAIR